MKLTMIGNYYINKIPEFSNQNIESILKITGISPFSIAGKIGQIEYLDKVNEIGIKVDVSKCFRDMLSVENNPYFEKLSKQNGRSYLTSNVSDYVVLDNSACLYDLFRTPDGNIYTCAKHNAFTDENFFSLEKEEQLKRKIVPYNNHEFNWRYYFDLFIEIIQERFSSDKIILIKATSIDFYLEKGVLKSYSEEEKRKRKFLNEIDNYFIERTGCYTICNTDWRISDKYEKWAFPQAIIENELGFEFRDNIEEICLSGKIHYEKDQENGFRFAVQSDREIFMSTKPLSVSNLERKEFQDENSRWKINFLKYYKDNDGFWEVLGKKAELSLQDIEEIEMYISNRDVNLNDILYIYILYSNAEEKHLFSRIIQLLFENKLEEISIMRFEKNRKRLKNYEHFDKELLNNVEDDLPTKVCYLKLCRQYYLLISKIDNHMEIQKLCENIEKKEAVDNEWHFRIHEITAALADFAIYIEKARRNQGKQPFVVDLSADEFEKSLTWIDYEYLLDNENILFNILNRTNGIESEKVEAKVNLEFLFDENTRIVRISDGLGDQILLFLFGRLLETKKKCRVFYDDTVYTYRKIHNGYELNKVITEDINDRLLTNILSKALIDKLQDNMYSKLYDYRLLYTLHDAGLDELTFVCMPTQDSVRTQYPGNKFMPVTFEPKERYFDKILDINFGIPYFSVIYRPPEVLVKYKILYEQFIRFNKIEDETNKKLAKEIVESDSIILHIRRGDFEKQGRIMNPAIYRNEIEKIKQIEAYKNKKYFVFSDDITWCKQNEDLLGLVNSDGEVFYVSHNRETNSWRDMQLMSYAKVMILANSGFSIVAFIANKNVEMVLGAYDFPKVGWKNKYDIREPQIKGTTSAGEKNSTIDYRGKKIVGRERTEWLNYWWDKADVINDNRILLIGDSLSRQYRGELANLTGMSVDFFASSTTIEDEMFWKELDLFLSVKEYKHKYAQIQIGYHGIDGVEGAIHRNSMEEFEKFYEKLVIKIKNIIPEVVIATATHVVCRDDKTKMDERINNEIIRRNEVIKRIAYKHELKINDMYTYMLNEGMCYEHTDVVHFEASSNSFIANKVAEILGVLPNM